MHKFNNEKTNQYESSSLEKWLSNFSYELAIDAVGLWKIIPVLRQRFHLENNELVEWVRRGILELTAKGAVPVKGSYLRKGWVQQLKYGITPHDIVETIIFEWQSAGEDPEPFDSVWFVLPRNLESNYE